MTQQNPTPFDEKAALAELERLQAAIQSARRQRLQVNDEFDTFVRRMRESRHGDPPVLVRSGERPRGGTAGGATPSDTAAPAPPPLAAAALSSSASPVVSEDFETDLMREPAAAGGRQAPRWLWLAAGGALVVAALAFVFVRGEPETPASDRPAAAAAAASAPAQSPAAAPAAAPAAPQPQAPVQIQLETIRPAWIRVIVDGEKVLEREMVAGQQLQYSAQREIAVRAGDGGAVLVRVRGGAPAAFGREGFPLTRTFRPVER